MLHLSEPLAVGELRVFYARTDSVMTSEQLTHCRELLSPEERARHLRFRFLADQQSYLAAHALTRGVLGQLLGEEAASLRFVVGERGRPELPRPEREPRIRFNLSHTRGLAAFAVTLHDDVGVDVEHMGRRLDMERIAASALSETEREALGLLQGDDRRKRFFDLWTLKEAYIKAVGMGLALPLTSITLHVDPGPQPRVSFGPRITDDPARWSFDVQTLSSGHTLAVALARRALEPWHAQELNPCDL